MKSLDQFFIAEATGHEFKTAVETGRSGLKSVGAVANGVGGGIFFGVSSEGVAVGGSIRRFRSAHGDTRPPGGYSRYAPPALERKMSFRRRFRSAARGECQRHEARPPIFYSRCALSARSIRPVTMGLFGFGRLQPHRLFAKVRCGCKKRKEKIDKTYKMDCDIVSFVRRRKQSFTFTLHLCNNAVSK